MTKPKMIVITITMFDADGHQIKRNLLDVSEHDHLERTYTLKHLLEKIFKKAEAKFRAIAEQMIWADVRMQEGAEDMLSRDTEKSLRKWTKEVE